MTTQRVLIYNNRKLDKTKIWLLFLFFGWSYGSMDKLLLQILFWITLGGLGLWTLIRLLTLNEAIREYNRGIAKKIGMTKKEMFLVGV